jgi:DNA transposition AAA+ family ATPase
MNEDQQRNSDRAFDMVAAESRIGRSARMLDDQAKLTVNQRVDIIDRVKRFIEASDYTQAAIARELGLSNTTISELMRDRWKGKTGDKHLVSIHNWLELAARRDGIVKSREFVRHSVAREILTVAGVVAETCQIGVIFGPARIGKTFTLRAIEGDQRFGNPVLVTVNESTMRPFALCRSICERLDISTTGTFDAVFRRLCARLTGTKRMLIFDEADLASYPALEMIRQLHDATGCPVLFAGKPKIYEHLGFRKLGEFSESLDQLAGRTAIKRDLTERTRGENGEPLYTRDDIRAMVKQSGLKLHVAPDAEKWLQGRASMLGMGGIGKAMVSLYLAAKIAYAQGDATITAQHLEDVEDLTLGSEDSERIADIAAEASGMRRVV